MARDVEAEDLLFECEALVWLPLRRYLDRLRAGGRARCGEEVEERGLALRAVALVALAALERAVHGGEQMGAWQAERVEGARLDQRLEHAPVHEPEVDAGAEVLERGKDAPRGAGLEDGLHRRLAHVLDRRQAEPDAGAPARRGQGGRPHPPPPPRSGPPPGRPGGFPPRR